MLTLSLLPLAGVSQEVRLVDRIERPMVYVVHDSTPTVHGSVGEPARHGAEDRGDGQGRGGADGVESERVTNPILSLLADPAMQELLGGGGTSFHFLRRVVSRASGEVELALTGIVPSGLVPSGDRPRGPASDGDVPLVIVRARLSAGQAERMQALLAAPAVGESLEMARPARIVNGHQVYRLNTRAEPGSADPGAPVSAGSSLAFQLEAAVVGNDLVVANHGTGIDEALGSSTRAPGADGVVLSADPRYLALREQLAPEPGAVIVFADWQRFARRLRAVQGFSGAMMNWSGLNRTDCVMASIESRDCSHNPRVGGSPERTWQSTVLLAVASGHEGRRGGGRRGRDGGGRDGHDEDHEHHDADDGIDGWLALVEPTPVAKLLGDVPRGGLGSAVLSIDPQRLLGQGEVRRHMGFASALAGGCGRCGLDMAGLVRRLGQRGSMQWLWLRGADDRMVPAFAVQAKSRAAALDLFRELAAACSSRQLGALERGRGRRPTQFALTGAGAFGDLRFAVVDDALVFAQDAEAIESAATEQRGGKKNRLESVVGDALHAFSGRKQSLASVKVGGLLHFDATAWLEARGLVPSDEPAATDDRVRVPTQHTGLIDVIPDAGAAGAVLRLQLYSTP